MPGEVHVVPVRWIRMPLCAGPELSLLDRGQTPRGSALLIVARVAHGIRRDVSLLVLCSSGLGWASEEWLELWD